MKIHHALIVLALISMVFLGATNFMDSLGDEYDQTADYSRINATKEMIDAQHAKINESFNQISGVSLNPDSDTDEVPAYELVKGGWGITIEMLKSWEVLKTMIIEIANVLSVPDYVISTIIIGLFATVVVMLLYMVFKWKVEN